jgi:hypothetical protein
MRKTGTYAAASPLHAELLNASKTPSDGIRTRGLSKIKGKDGPETSTENVGVLTTPLLQLYSMLTRPGN